jgi:transposase-like protein
MVATTRKNPTRAKSSESRYSLMEFMREFADDDACLDWLWTNRYAEDGEHAECPKCEQVRAFKKYATKQQRQSWTCTGCGYHLHPTAGTIFHKSSTSLHLWFYAIYLMTSTRCGISAKQMERELGVTYKTAWRIAKLIRNELMDQDDEPLDGHVEVDETWIGGKLKFRGRQGSTGPVPGSKALTNKTAVAGAVARGGRVVAVTVPNVRKATLIGHVERRVLPSATVYTDELKSYDTLTTRGYAHRRITHSEHVYVSGDIHTNTIEGFWSLVKRGIGGVYHAVSAKHLQGYLNEYAWRYNHRDDERSQFETLLLRAARS